MVVDENFSHLWIDLEISFLEPDVVELRGLEIGIRIE